MREKRKGIGMKTTMAVTGLLMLTGGLFGAGFYWGAGHAAEATTAPVTQAATVTANSSVPVKQMEPVQTTPAKTTPAQTTPVQTAPMPMPSDEQMTNTEMKQAEQEASAKHEAYVKSLANAPGKQIGSFSTSLAGHSAEGRVMNIELASKLINGKILLPGETFSFNDTTGDSNRPEAGWKLATVIVGKKFEQGYGGGICQVSSTLYNAVMQSGLQVVERYTHSLPVGYVAPGHDATVSYPELDFKFRNQTNAPMRIVTKVVNGDVVAQVYALPEEK